MPEDSELDRIDPQPREVKLSTGFSVELARLRTRQFFRLLRILTHGAGPALTQAQLNFDGEASEFAARLLTLVVMSIPDAEEETIRFLASMTRPVGVVDKPATQLTKQEAAANKALWDQFGEEMHNPDLTDLLDLTEAIIEQESPELQALGKKLRTMFALFQKTGQDKEAPEPEAPVEEITLPAPSRRRSTS
jgi:hypothetical protein